MKSIFQKIFTNKKILSALVALVVAVIAAFGFNVSPEVTAALQNLITALAG